MGPTMVLLNRLSRQGHPWARGFERSEIPTLIEAVRVRFAKSDAELDLSPSSLRRLERYLAEYHSSTHGLGRNLADEELVNLIREVTAYVGETLVRSTDAHWKENLATLFFVSLRVDGPWKTTKETTFTSNHPATYVLGSIVASAWDLIASSKKPRLHQLYDEIQKKHMTERL
jgi:hypothetical protein